MRNRTLLAVPLLLILAIPGHGLAQDAEQAAAPDMEPVMVGVFVDHVRPAMIPEYEAKIAEVVEKFQAAGVDAPAWDGFSSSELGYAYVIPAEQGDRLRVASMINRLLDQRIEVSRARRKFVIGDETFAAGDFVVLLDQPYRNYAVDLLQPQEFPADAEHEPYDDISWALPVHYGMRALP